MKKTTKYYTLLCMLAVAAVVLLTLFSYSLVHPLTHQEVSIDLTLGDHIGVNVDQDALHFGTLPPGAIAQRSLLLRAEEHAVAIQLIVQDLPFVIPEEETLLLDKGESRLVRFFARPDASLEKKTYTGTLLILTKRL